MLFKVALPTTGNHAVYEFDGPATEASTRAFLHGVSLGGFARMYTHQLAVQFGDEWIRSGLRPDPLDADTAAQYAALPLTD